MDCTTADVGNSVPSVDSVRAIMPCGSHFAVAHNSYASLVWKNVWQIEVRLLNNFCLHIHLQTDSTTQFYNIHVLERSPGITKKLVLPGDPGQYRYLVCRFQIINTDTSLHCTHTHTHTHTHACTHTIMVALWPNNIHLSITSIIFVSLILPIIKIIFNCEIYVCSYTQRNNPKYTRKFGDQK